MRSLCEVSLQINPILFCENLIFPRLFFFRNTKFATQEQTLPADGRSMVSEVCNQAKCEPKEKAEAKLYPGDSDSPRVETLPQLSTWPPEDHNN